MDKKRIFSSQVVQAILTRKERVRPAMTVVSKLLRAYEMSDFIPVAERLILTKEASDEFLKDHVRIDFTTGDILLDKTALCYYKDIILGYVSEEQFLSYLDFIDSTDSLENINNLSIKLYREKSLFNLIKTMTYHTKYRKSLPDEVKLINIACLLELLSRTKLPKVYYFFKELPFNLRVRYIANNIRRSLEV